MARCRRDGPITEGGDTTTLSKAKRKSQRKKVKIPTPAEWAEEQLKNAPQRSERWAREVAAIYCLDITEEKPTG
jgi:hypothetical protein